MLHLPKGEASSPQRLKWARKNVLNYVKAFVMHSLNSNFAAHKHKKTSMFRNIPTVTKNLLIINIVAFLAAQVLSMSGIDLNDIFGLHFFMASDFRIYQLVTYMFMHGNFTHIFFNMFALWMFGCVVENVWGPKKYLFYYMVCGIGAGLMQELAQFVSYSVEGLAAYSSVNMGNGMNIPMETYLNMLTTVGASGAIYAILLAFGMTFPNVPAAHTHQGQVVRHWLCRSGAVLGLQHVERRSGTPCPLRRNVVRLHSDTLLEATSLLRLWRFRHQQGGSVLQQHAHQLGTPQTSKDYNTRTTLRADTARERLGL